MSHPCLLNNPSFSSKKAFMKNEKADSKAIVDFWKTVNPIREDRQMPVININEVLTSIFNPGKHFYFLVNFFDLRLEYVHHTITDLLGIYPEEFNLHDSFFKILHPDDFHQFKLKEQAAGVFFYQRVPDKITMYKSTYTLRMAHRKGHYVHFLVQNIALTVTDGKIHHVLSVLTDVTFMNLLPDDRISFIGINGEPSYYSLSTDPENILQPQKDLLLSKREQEIVRLLAEGLASKQIADELKISTHTVDTHRRNLLKKTGAKNTLELTVVCLKKGLV